MGGFNLPEGFQDDLEAILQRERTNLTPPRRNLPPICPNPPQTNPVHSEIPIEPVLSKPPPIEPIHPSSIASTSSGATVKAIHDYSFLSISNVVVGPNILSGKEEFVLKPALITMVKQALFLANLPRMPMLIFRIF